jgi:hypothetical protein
MNRAEMIRRLELKPILTVAALMGVLAFATFRAHRWQLLSWSDWRAVSLKRRAPSPEDSVFLMLDRARIGDVEAYLDCFDDPLRAQLAETIKESTVEQFRSYLVSQNAAIRGVAVSLTDRPSPDEARVRVEYVYSDRNEVQEIYVKQEGEKWKIVKVMGSERIKTLIPYGTDVTD